MGTVLGAFLTRAGQAVDLVTRNKEHVRALSEGGARIDFPAAGGGFTCRVSALTPDMMSGRYDVIFLMTKQSDNAATVRSFLGNLAEGGAVCTMQNGLPEYSVAEAAGEANTLGCAVSWGATYICPGRAALTSSPDAMSFSLGSPFGNGEKVGRVAAILSKAGRVETPGNFIGARWSKLIVNAAFSTLSAATSLTFGQIAGGLSSRALALRMLREGAAVAKACGVTPDKIQGHDLVGFLSARGALKRAAVFLALPVAMKKHKKLVSGMYYDIISGKKCDVDLVAGEIVRRAEEAGVDVPALSAAIAVIHAAERGEIEVSPRNIRRISGAAAR